MTQSSRVLATRCPHCHTVFRVVADQLKLRDGLVRCGHCREVFDGRAHLCDPPAEEKETSTSPAASARGGVEPVSGTTVADRTGNDVTPSPISASSSPSSDAIPHTTPLSSSLGVTPDETSPSPNAAPNATPLSSPSPALASAQESVTPLSPSAGGKPVPEMLTPTAIAALLGSPDESRARMRHGPGRYMDDDPTVLPAPTASPSADASAAAVAKQNKDKRPGAARIVWRVLMALAVLGLLGQWAWLERAALVDRIPALHGVFAAIGRPVHVTIALPRQPDMIRISSVTLVTDEAGASQDADTASAATAATPGDTVPMTLTVFIRNQADYALAWPSLELTLSDIDGKPVVRRVFSANEYVTEATTRNAGLAPRNERTIRLRLSAQAALASNYRVLAFYP
ncbi:DUF3426 domain-containing protein [Pandoraea sp. NPDC087047]|uniref:DUF3426 domain-containing protein n=1 Tax=Pandoraea sp. NPDC087047 TaxID=3364390 RepID=UPI00382F3909